MALASEKFELSNVEILSRIKVTEKIQGKWFQLAVSSCYPSSSYTRDSTVFFEFICN